MFFFGHAEGVLRAPAEGVLLALAEGVLRARQKNQKTVICSPYFTNSSPPPLGRARVGHTGQTTA